MTEIRIYLGRIGWRFRCSMCGDCGGNYPTEKQAKLIAEAHSKLPHVPK